jgi:hypothetical protein
VCSLGRLESGRYTVATDSFISFAVEAYGFVF